MTVGGDITWMFGKEEITWMFGKEEDQMEQEARHDSRWDHGCSVHSWGEKQGTTRSRDREAGRQAATGPDDTGEKTRRKHQWTEQKSGTWILMGSIAEH